MIVFDFDDTLIKGRIQRHLRQLLPIEIRKKVEKKRIQGYYKMMQCTYEQLNKQNISIDQLKNRLSQQVQLLEGVQKTIQRLHNLGYKLVIISGGDSLLIQIFLQSKNLLHYFQKIQSACRAVYSDNGFVFQYNQHQHNCDYGSCGKDYCKGVAFQQICDQQKAYFVGDGSNDYCIYKKIKILGGCLARQQFGLDQILQQSNKKDYFKWSNFSIIQQIIGNHK